MAVGVCTAVSLMSQLKAWGKDGLPALHQWQGVALAVHCAAGAGAGASTWGVV